MNRRIVLQKGEFLVFTGSLPEKCVFMLEAIFSFRRNMYLEYFVKVVTHLAFIQIGGHSFSTRAKFSKKLTFLNLWYVHVCAYQGVRKGSFSENFAQIPNDRTLVGNHIFLSQHFIFYFNSEKKYGHNRCVFKTLSGIYDRGVFLRKG